MGMRKLIPYILLLFSSSAWAVSPGILNGMTYSRSGCPAYFADTNVLLSGDFDHPLGTAYVCNSSGTAIQGTNTDLTIGTSYGENSTNGSTHDTADEGLSIIQSEDQYLDGNAAITIWFRIRLSDTLDQNVRIFEANGSSTNRFSIRVYNNSQINAQFYINVEDVTSDSALAGTGTWYDMAYSFDRPNEDQSINVGDAWSTGDDDELTSDPGGIDEIVIGNDLANQSGTSSEQVQIDRWVIMSGYKTAKPTNWSN
jgi:hypothetical protein